MKRQKILLLGQSQSNHQQQLGNFAQLRTWSIQKFLENLDIETVFLPLTDQSSNEGFDVYHPQTLQFIQEIGHQVDACITAGPFLPLLAIHALPNSCPLWLDYPSDALADFHAKKGLYPQPTPLEKATLDTQQLQLQGMIEMAFYRADAISVISERQKYATLGQLLMMSQEDIPIHTLPIAFDFPNPVQKQESSTKHSNQAQIALSGSLNAWLNVEEIIHKIQHSSFKLHCTGGDINHYPSQHSKLQDIPNIIQHGWVSLPELERILHQCRYGLWVDKGNIEPLLGSRTRALFYIWHGLIPIGSCNTELAAFLKDAQALIPWDANQSIEEMCETSILPISSIQKLCADHFHPEIVYEPLKNWLHAPKRITRPLKDNLFGANQRLEQELRQIHQSKTWRWGSKLHHSLNQIVHRIVHKNHLRTFTTKK